MEERLQKRRTAILIFLARMNLDCLKELKTKDVRKTLAASLRDDKVAIEDVYKPYLLKEGLVERTPRGRQVAKIAYQHFGKDVPKGLF